MRFSAVHSHSLNTMLLLVVAISQVSSTSQNSTSAAPTPIAAGTSSSSLQLILILSLIIICVTLVIVFVLMVLFAKLSHLDTQKVHPRHPPAEQSGSQNDSVREVSVGHILGEAKDDQRAIWAAGNCSAFSVAENGANSVLCVTCGELHRSALNGKEFSLKPVDSKAAGKAAAVEITPRSTAMCAAEPHASAVTPRPTSPVPASRASPACDEQPVSPLRSLSPHEPVSPISDWDRESFKDYIMRSNGDVSHYNEYKKYREELLKEKQTIEQINNG